MVAPVGGIRLTPYARERVRRFTESAMTTPITIKRGSYGGFDPETGEVTGLVESSTVYEGTARVKTITGQGSIAVGDGEFDTRQVQISIPWDAPSPARDDIVGIGEGSLSDEVLAGSTYRIMEVEGGSFFGDARRLSCVGWSPSRFWGEQ